MKTGVWSWIPAMGVLALAAALVPGAAAQCGRSTQAAKPISWQAQAAGAQLKPAAFVRAANDAAETPSIVGMWHVIFTAETTGPTTIPKTVIDSALVVWHSDGTEIMNSGRPPQDGNFCMGVWEQTGKLSYQLNHFAWAANNYTPGTAEGVIGAPIGPVHYTEAVTLGPEGKHYTGTFTLTEYDTSGNVLVAFTGVLKATRITVDTTVSDLL